MSTKHHDFRWIQTQLTLARWYLDAAAYAVAGTVHHHVHQAQRTYELTVQSLSQLSLDEPQRSCIERELAALRVRFGNGESLTGGGDWRQVHGCSQGTYFMWISGCSRLDHGRKQH